MSVGDPKPPHLLPQRRAADAQEVGRLAKLAVRATEGRHDVRPLALIPDGCQGWPLGVGAEAVVGRMVGEQVVGADPRSGRQCHGTLDPVPQFPDVTGPIVRQGGRLGPRGQALGRSPKASAYWRR